MKSTRPYLYNRSSIPPKRGRRDFASLADPCEENPLVAAYAGGANLYTYVGNSPTKPATREPQNRSKGVLPIQAKRC